MNQLAITRLNNMTKQPRRRVYSYMLMLSRGLPRTREYFRKTFYSPHVEVEFSWNFRKLSVNGRQPLVAKESRTFPIPSKISCPKYCNFVERAFVDASPPHVYNLNARPVDQTNGGSDRGERCSLYWYVYLIKTFAFRPMPWKMHIYVVSLIRRPR